VGFLAKLPVGCGPPHAAIRSGRLHVLWQSHSRNKTERYQHAPRGYMSRNRATITRLFYLSGNLVLDNRALLAFAATVGMACAIPDTSALNSVGSCGAESSGGGCEIALDHVGGASGSALVPFTNSNPYADNFRLKIRPFVIGEKPVQIRQGWDDRKDDEPEPTGMKWTGAAVWDAAVVLSEFLADDRNKDLVRDCRVLELGAGHGMLSVVAGLHGARSVTATDYEEKVLGLCRANLEMNLPEMVRAGMATAKPLAWGSEADVAALEPPFDMVVGSDLVYREALFKPLVQSLEALSDPRTTVVLAHKPRGLGEDKFLHFLKRRFQAQFPSLSDFLLFSFFFPSS